MLSAPNISTRVTDAMDTNIVLQRLQALPAEQRTLAVGFILGLSAQQAQENEHNKKRQQ